VRAADVACGVEPPQTDVTWADVYRGERDGLIRLAYLITGSQAVAEDLVQDTFVRVMPRIDPAADPGPYLRRSVINACYSWHRRFGREVGGLSVEPEAREPRYVTDDEVDMWDALAKLPPKRRTVLVLRYYMDLSEAEVASTLGCRVGTVKSTSHRALKDLRRALDR
jgi:RNA polymerase sigma-70 factor (sigma-E family)